MRFIHINEYEYMNNYVQYTHLHTHIRICVYVEFIHCNKLTIILMLLTFSSKGSSLVTHWSDYNSSYYIAPVGDRTHDLPHAVASNMVNVSHAITHSATAAVN